MSLSKISSFLLRACFRLEAPSISLFLSGAPHIVGLYAGVEVTDRALALLGGARAGQRKGDRMEVSVDSRAAIDHGTLGFGAQLFEVLEKLDHCRFELHSLRRALVVHHLAPFVGADDALMCLGGELGRFLGQKLGDGFFRGNVQPAIMADAWRHHATSAWRFFAHHSRYCRSHEGSGQCSSPTAMPRQSSSLRYSAARLIFASGASIA